MAKQTVDWVTALQAQLRNNQPLAALAITQQRLRIAPTDPQALDALVRLALQTRQAHQAVPPLIAAAAQMSQNLPFQTQIAAALDMLNADASALPVYQRIADLTAEFAPQVKAAELALRFNQYALAEHYLLRALAADAQPTQPAQLAQAHYQLAVVTEHFGREGEVMQYLDRALALAPNHLAALFMRAGLLRKAKRNVAARQDLELSLSLAPENATALFNLGTFEESQGKDAKALSLLEAAHARAPERGEILTALMLLQRKLAQWSSLETSTATLHQLIAKGQTDAIAPFLSLVAPFDAAEQMKVAKRWGETQYPPVTRALHTAKLATQTAAHQRNKNQGNKNQQSTNNTQRLRVAYVSADMHEHATAYLMAQVFALHDRSRCEIYCYYWGGDDASPMRQRIKDTCDHFVAIGQLSDAQAAAHIASDQIDVLIDLKGYTFESRAGIFMQRPAPLQINYLGYPGTMAHRAWDALIADEIVIPQHLAQYFLEKIYRLPVCYQPNDNQRAIAAKPSRSALGLPEQAFVFGSFNQMLKVEPNIFAVWLRLLKAVPQSVLWLLAPRSLAQQQLVGLAQQADINPVRIIFAPPLPQAQHLARLQCMDLALDTFPCNSHTTASDALWAGVPLLTQIGETFASRVAASLLHHAGFDDLITTSLAEYEALAIALGNDPIRYAILKKRFEYPKNFPIFDSAATVRALENAYVALYAEKTGLLR